MEKRIEEFYEGIWEKAKANLAKDGYVAPMVFLIFKDEQHVMPAGFETNEEKLRFFATIQTIAAETHAIAVIHLSEVWAARATEAEKTKTDEEVMKVTPPSERKDRFEALSLTVVAANGECFSRIAGIVKSESHAFLIEEQDFKEAKSFLIQPWTH